MGTMPGAQIVRFPDIKTSNIDFTGKTAILFCHNGNRGYETCQALAKMGIDCRFLVGGLEKWLVEQRPLDRPERAHACRSSRAAAASATRRTLLDTPRGAGSRRERERACSSIARYPGEFASGASAERGQPADPPDADRRS